MSYIKNLAIGILISLITILIFLGFMEVGLRLFLYQGDDFNRMDSELGFIGDENKEGRYTSSCYDTKVKINSEGFRDVEHKIQKPENIYRIAVFGDSFLQALQVPLEDIFTRKLEKDLNQQGYNTEVLSFGVSGYGTDQEYLTMKKYALKYNPDLIVLAFLTGNDIKNNYSRIGKPYFTFSNSGELVLNSFVLDKQSWLKKFLYNNSHVVRFLIKRISQLNGLKNFLAENLGLFGGQITVSTYDLTHNEIYLVNWPENLNNAWRITKSIILKMREDAESNNADFLLFSLSNQAQLEDDYLNKLQDTNPGFDFRMDEPERKLTNFTEDNGIKYLQALPAMLKLKEEGKSAGLSCDGHWSEDGHERASEILAEYIINNFLTK